MCVCVCVFVCVCVCVCVHVYNACAHVRYGTYSEGFPFLDARTTASKCTKFEYGVYARPLFALVLTRMCVCRNAMIGSAVAITGVLLYSLAESSGTKAKKH
jgi:hypothetical protein